MNMELNNAYKNCILLQCLGYIHKENSLPYISGSSANSLSNFCHFYNHLPSPRISL